jgi:hypothetical protein
MLEALVAVGLAGNVFQFASCVGTLAKEAKSIQDSGSTRELPTIKSSTQQAIEQAVLLKTRLKGPTKTLTEEDQVRLMSF